MTLNQTTRVLSLDAFRGIAITGMILVNTPGSWKYVYSPLRHAEWHGCSPTDLVFPFFLFIVGVAMSFSFSKRIEQGFSKSQLHLKILKRSLIIFGLGLFLNAYPFNIPFSLTELQTSFHFIDILKRFETVRIVGVLQRIAMCYLFASLITINLNKRGQVLTSISFLALYWLLMILFSSDPFSLEENLIRKIDLFILGKNHMYTGMGIPFDPEGLLSTIPAIVTVIFGLFVGDFLRKNISRVIKTYGLLIAGISGIIFGYILGFGFPINKQLWSPSYTIYTAGWATLILSGCFWLIDVKKISMWAKPFIIFGTNPIFVFTASGLAVKTILRIKIYSGESSTSLYSWLYNSIFVPIGGNLNGSLFFAISWILFWFLVLSYMYKKKVFIKI